MSKSIEQARDGSVTVDARMSVGDFNQQFNAQLLEAPEYETLAGFIQKELGRLPEVGDIVTHQPLTLTVQSKTARRIRTVRVMRPETGTKE